MPEGHADDDLIKHTPRNCGEIYCVASYFSRDFKKNVFVIHEYSNTFFGISVNIDLKEISYSNEYGIQNSMNVFKILYSAAPASVFPEDWQ